MKYLLDTHVFLWAIAGDRRISEKAHEVLFQKSHDFFLSAGSVWEIVMKVQVGKLPLPARLAPYLKRQMAANRVQVLPISFAHVVRIEQLPLHHRDPFDRILVAQSIEEEMLLVSADPEFRRYPVKVVW